MNSGRPIVLGIVGDSAAGKSTLTNGLTRLLGPDRVTHICTDDYHKYDRAERARLNITALHPDCNFLDILELHLERAHYGQPILKPVYDHSTGSLVRPEYVRPLEFVIVEGLLGFHSAAMRQFYDVKVYLDPPEDLRCNWKIKRDTTKRGYTVEQVLAELEKREADSGKFIRPQREYADIVVRFYPAAEPQAEQVDSHLNVQLVLRPTIPHPDLSYLFHDDGTRSPGVRLELGRDEGRPADFLKVDGTVSREHAAELEETIWRHLPDLRPLRADEFGDYNHGLEVRHSDPLALTQLLITYHLLRAYSGQARKSYAPPIAALSRLDSARERTPEPVTSER
ncbi:MAG TPA: phosphoribulokinase [Candidatus Bathyarchaeia archaeon]|nr:phosphoribulokinase [Candidatus Bathyarchaeia archaeon]